MINVDAIKYQQTSDEHGTVVPRGSAPFFYFFKIVKKIKK
jgi:hypothetical protein